MRDSFIKGEKRCQRARDTTAVGRFDHTNYRDSSDATRAPSHRPAALAAFFPRPLLPSLSLLPRLGSALSSASGPDVAYRRNSGKGPHVGRVVHFVLGEELDETPESSRRSMRSMSEN
jgi:hypothetical protein